jgi:hypothetical protein
VEVGAHPRSGAASCSAADAMRPGVHRQLTTARGHE